VRNMLLGLETEYALGGGRRDELIERLVYHVRDILPGLQGMNEHDWYLGNGARFYVDAGRHPEYATPECENPSEVVRRQLAGDRLLSEALKRVPRELSAGSGAGLFKCNVDYSGAKTTWGSHESYMYRVSPTSFPSQLIPHLVSRVVFTGAGGFNPLSAGIEFTLSPRASYLEQEISDSSTEARGIFHTKNEGLGRRGYSRLHLLCGESLCSQLGLWLRVGTTAVVVAMIDAGLSPGDCVLLRSPLDALNTFVSDPTCRATVCGVSGSDVSAIDIQRHYLEVAESCIDNPQMPPWTAQVCQQWRAVLDRLDSDTGSLSGTLDWAIKLALYREHAAQKGVPWSDLAVWNRVLRKFRVALCESPIKGRSKVEIILGQTSEESPIPDTVKALTPYLERHGLDWDTLRPVVDLRKELFELDFRFGQLGGSGLFDKLDKAGVLSHAAPGVARIDAAVQGAPRKGRAALRARSIRRYSGRDLYFCNWTGIRDGGKNRQLDMTDPFASRAAWQEGKTNPRDLERLRIRRLIGRDPGLFDMEDLNEGP
jgi:hypothetical protein